MPVRSPRQQAREDHDAMSTPIQMSQNFGIGGLDYGEISMLTENDPFRLPTSAIEENAGFESFESGGDQPSSSRSDGEDHLKQPGQTRSSKRLSNNMFRVAFTQFLRFLDRQNIPQSVVARIKGLKSNQGLFPKVWGILTKHGLRNAIRGRYRLVMKDAIAARYGTQCKQWVQAYQSWIKRQYEALKKQTIQEAFETYWGDYNQDHKYHKQLKKVLTFNKNYGSIYSNQ